MRNLLRWKKLAATVVLSTMSFGGIYVDAYDECCYYEDPCCVQDCSGSSYAWIGGAILGAAAGAGAGYAAGCNNHRKRGKGGRQGEKGEKGKVGDKGPQGKNGLNGKNGQAGPNGPDGPDGVDGCCCDSCNDCCCEPVDTCNPLEILVSTAGIVGEGTTVLVSIFDPQRLLAEANLTTGGPSLTVSFIGSEPKLTGIYLIRFIFLSETPTVTGLGTVFFNADTGLTPVALYSIGDEFYMYCQFCPECVISPIIPIPPGA